MSVKVLLLTAMIIFTMATYSTANALSCPRERSEAVISNIDIAQKAGKKVFFGKAELIDVFKTKDQHFAVFKNMQPYLTEYHDAFNEKITVFIPSIFVNWGPFHKYFFAEQDLRKRKETQHYFFIYDPEKNIWEYGGPGGCTFFSDGQWKKLQDGFYDKYISKEGEDHAN